MSVAWQSLLLLRTLYWLVRGTVRGGLALIRAGPHTFKPFYFVPLLPFRNVMNGNTTYDFSFVDDFERSDVCAQKTHKKCAQERLVTFSFGSLICRLVQELFEEVSADPNSSIFEF